MDKVKKEIQLRLKVVCRRKPFHRDSHKMKKTYY